MHQQRSNQSVAITFNPHPALYRMGSEPAPKPPSPEASPYQRLKKLDEQLDRGKEILTEARGLYQQTLKEFACLCHQLWKEEKAQGSRQGKGFRCRLQEAGIKVGRAYRAMRKFFPADFPANSKPKKAKALTSSAANKVGLRFTGKLHHGKETLQCIFTLTPEEKVEFERCLKVVDASQVQCLLLEAVKQVAASKPSVTENPNSEIANKDAGCCTIVHDSGNRRFSDDRSTPSIRSSPSISSTPAEVRVVQNSEIANNNAGCDGVSLAGKVAIPVPAQTSSATNNVGYTRHSQGKIPIVPPGQRLQDKMNKRTAG